jgi:hypothetical protein
MNDVLVLPTLPAWQAHFAWTAVLLALLWSFKTATHRVIHALRARHLVYCPVHEVPAQVTFESDVRTGHAAVTRCSLLDPPHQVTCGQSCLHRPSETEVEKELR